MRKRIFIVGVLALSLMRTQAQELQAKISINSSQIGSQVDKKIFGTLQTGLNNFMNNRKWTNETFQQQEKIVCNFILTLDKVLGPNVYQATLAVQAARPVYNSSYQTPLINHMDEAISFRYVEYQPIEFNENRVQGTDPVAANLTAIFAYYAYVILGLDFSSFAPRQGDQFYQKAQNIVNNAPESREVIGWKPFDGLRNRYWLVENLTNNRYNVVHDAYYSYFRLGMDNMYENEATARTAILNSLNMLSILNKDIPNSMIIQFFFQGRSGELIKIFKKANPDEKNKARDVLTQVDVGNSALYKLELR
jgi:hypothetical protein